MAQDHWQVDPFRRMDDFSWRLTSHGPSDEVDLDILNGRFKVDDVYAKVEAFGGPRARQHPPSTAPTTLPPALRRPVTLSATPPSPPLSWHDYIAADLAYDGKLEFYDGEVYAMAGDTPAHAALSANVVSALSAALRGRPCVTMSSDVRIALQDDSACYPDAAVVCGDAVFRAPHTLANPVVVAEVLSPTTASWDRTGKLERYCALPSLRYVLLVAHDAWHVTLYARQADGTWTWSTARAGEHLVLGALEVTLAVDDLYREVERVGGPSREDRPAPPRG